MDYDGCSELWVEKWEDIAAFFGSEEYKRVMQPDCPNFMAMPVSPSHACDS